MNALKQIIIDHPFLNGLRPEHLEIVADCASEAGFAADQIIFREGEIAGQLYLIQSGRVALEAHRYKDGDVPIQTLGAGDVLGWSWLFPPFRWHFQARAIEPASVVALNGAHLLVAGNENPEFGFELMKRVVQVVIQRLQATRKQLLDRQGPSGAP